jgi:hypothetical protein
MFILKTRAADWAILQLMTSIDHKAQDFGGYCDIYLCIIKEQCNDQEESKWKHQKGSQNNVNDGVCQIKWLHIVDTAMAKWASTDRQRFLVMCHGKSHLRYVVVSHKGNFGCLYRQNRLLYPPCPIMKLSANGASTIFGHASWEITPPIGCTQSQRNFWLPL